MLHLYFININTGLMKSFPTIMGTNNFQKPQLNFILCQCKGWRSSSTEEFLPSKSDISSKAQIWETDQNSNPCSPLVTTGPLTSLLRLSKSTFLICAVIMIQLLIFEPEDERPKFDAFCLLRAQCHSQYKVFIQSVVTAYMNNSFLLKAGVIGIRPHMFY